MDGDTGVGQETVIPHDCAPPHFDLDFGMWCWELAELLSPAAQCPAERKYAEKESDISYSLARLTPAVYKQGMI